MTKGKIAGQLTQQQMKEMELYRSPGAQFFLMSIIASYLEVAIGEPIPNRFRLIWRDSNLQKGIGRWQPILNIVLAFGETLVDYLKDGLKSNEKVRVAESKTRQTLAAIKGFHANEYSAFAKDILLS